MLSADNEQQPAHIQAGLRLRAPSCPRGQTDGGGERRERHSARWMGAIPKSGDFDSSIRSLPGTTCDKMVEDPRSAFNFAGKIHLPTTVSGESSVSENLAPDALEN